MPVVSHAPTNTTVEKNRKPGTEQEARGDGRRSQIGRGDGDGTQGKQRRHMAGAPRGVRRLKADYCAVVCCLCRVMMGEREWW